MTERLHKIVWLGAVVAAVLFGQDTPGPPARKLPLPADVLNESHLTGEQLLPANRCFLYLELAHAAATIAPGLAKQWSQEVFDLAQQLPSGWNRSALRKNAIQGMAAVDPARAFAMIPSMETPVPISGDIIPEDLRASVAGWVYPQFWSQEQSATRMASIRAQAQTIASTGQYPFAGVVPILEYLAEHDRQQEEAWWSELIRIYHADTPRIRDRDEKFVEFLKATWTIAPAASRKVALEIAVQKILDQPADSSLGKTGGYQAVARTNGAAIALTDPRQALLVRILPLIKESDPGLLDDLAEKIPAFAAAKADGFDLGAVSEATVYGSQNSSSTPQLQAGNMLGEQAMADRATRLVATDPSTALRIALSLNSLRDDALGRISDAITDGGAQGDPTLARNIEEQIEATKNKRLQLNLLVLQASAAQATKPQLAEAAIREGFDLGESLYDEFLQSHPTAGPDEAPAMQPLRRLVRIGMSACAWDTVGYVRQINDVSLRCWLLVDVARALHRPTGAAEKR